ncbi:unnamed protein product [Psylliodes chrysocephalus]|uniref:Uncharacterized protein n=1 Tax=Psylliodes chrysocephalus TaxID=3402493 RepID=A0A9P0G1S7_9CUCU|nr:unnamed protein product [Psylliodes chrysocephala]
MKYYLLLLMPVLSCLTGISLARKLPSFIEVCRPKHTDINECLKRNIEILKPKLKDGIPEMHIPSFRPYVLPQANVQLGDNFFATIKNLSLSLPKSFIVDDLKADLDKVKLYIKLRIPEIVATTQYSLKGRLLILNLDGEGAGYINLTDVHAEVTGYGKKENRNGKDYLVIGDFDILPKTKSMHLILENLFPNNQELTDSANKLFNENQQVLLEDFNPAILKIVKEIIIGLMSNFFNRYSYDVLFPDD